MAKPIKPPKPLKEGLPTVYMGSAVADENEGNISFRIFLDHTYKHDVVITYAINEGTATSPDDFLGPLGGTVVISAGQLSGQLSRPILDNQVFEGDEEFTVSILSASIPAQPDKVLQIVQSQNFGEIREDDPAPTISINDVAVNEGDDTLTLTVTKNGLTDLEAQVEFTVFSGTALINSDFTIASGPYNGSLIFAPDETTKEITFNITDDAVHEPTEYFQVNLSGGRNISSMDGGGIGMIVDNEPNAPPVAVDDSFTFNEDGFATGNVLLNDSDPDGDPVQLVGHFSPNGPVSIEFTYDTNGNPDGGLIIEWIGPLPAQAVTFDYLVWDDSLASDRGTINILPATPLALNPDELF